jgi:hypothetical protein
MKIPQRLRDFHGRPNPPGPVEALGLKPGEQVAEYLDLASA